MNTYHGNNCKKGKTHLSLKILYISFICELRSVSERRLQLIPQVVLMKCQFFHEPCCIRSHGYGQNKMTDSKQELSLQTTIPRWTLLAMLFSALLKRKIHVSKTHIIISSVPICSIKIEVWLIHVLTLIPFSFDNLVDQSRSIHMAFYCGNLADHSPLELVFYFLAICLPC